MATMVPRCSRGLRQASCLACSMSTGPSTSTPFLQPMLPRHALMAQRLLHTVTDRPTRPRSRRAATGSDAQEGAEFIAAPETRLSWQRADLHVVLVNPQIPQNAGNIARTCAGTAVALHLVEPLGFELTDAKLKRAGLDYWKAVCVQTHPSWQAFHEFFQNKVQGPKRLVAFTVYGSQYYAGPEFSYQPGDWLIFGSETSGLPLQAHRDIEASGGALVKIPIVETHVRSLNLAVSVGIAAYEALRQLDMGKHQVNPRLSPTLEEAEQSHKERLKQQTGGGKGAGASPSE